MIRSTFLLSSLLLAVASGASCNKPSGGIKTSCRGRLKGFPLPLPKVKSGGDFKRVYLIGYPSGTRSPKYGVCFARKARKPHFSVHTLSRSSVRGECSRRSCPRPHSFKADRRLCAAEQDREKWYARSGFHKGHLVPNAAFGSKSLRKSTFTVINIVPQTGNRNSNLWAGLESALKKLVTASRKSFDRIYVYTAMAYKIDRVRPVSYESSAGERMYYPHFTYKVAVCVQGKQAAIMVCPSDNFQTGRGSRVKSPIGTHQSKCPRKTYESSCVPLAKASCASLSSQCYDASNSRWTVGTLLKKGGLSWTSVERTLRRRYSVSKQHTCFSFLSGERQTFCTHERATLDNETVVAANETTSKVITTTAKSDDSSVVFASPIALLIAFLMNKLP